MYLMTKSPHFMTNMESNICNASDSYHHKLSLVDIKKKRTTVTIFTFFVKPHNLCTSHVKYIHQMVERIFYWTV